MIEHTPFLLALACIFGFWMAWGVGANDVANAMGTSVGSKALTIRNAIIIAAIFEFVGAFFAGGAVTHTLSQGIANISYFNTEPTLLIHGMLAALFAAALWLLIATHMGWPVSTTHSIVGAIVGFTLISRGPEAIYWEEMTSIVLSWIISPLMGGVLAYILFMSVQRLIFRAASPFHAAKRYVPFYVFFSCLIIVMVTLTKGFKYIGLPLTFSQSLLYSMGFSVLVALISILLLHRIKWDPSADKTSHFTNVEKVFSVLMMFTACAMAFAHGSNDVANAVGPLAAIVETLRTQGITEITSTPPWVLLLGGVGIVVGLVTYGHKVILTIGSGITELTPSRGFAATLSAATTVVLASGTGLPISTTHTLVGAVLGVGFARGIAAINLGVVKNIFISWIVTLPVGAGLAIIMFMILQKLLGS